MAYSYQLSTLNQSRDLGSSMVATKSIVGNKVYSTDDEFVGILKDIVIDVVTGELTFTKISLEGLTDDDSRHLAIPYECCHVDPYRDCIHIDYKSDVLGNVGECSHSEETESFRNDWPYELKVLS